MTDTSTYPDAVDANQHDEVLAQAQPDEFRDVFALVADGLHKVQAELGVNPKGDGFADLAERLAAIATGLGEAYALLFTLAMDAPDGYVLKVEGGAADWHPDSTGGGGGGGSSLLARTIKDDASLQPVTATDSPSDVDASLHVDFTVPASGEVFVDLSALASLALSTSGSWTLDDGGGQVAAAQVAYDNNQAHIYMRLYLGGLTPDDSVTLTWRHVRTFGSGAFNTIYGGEAGPAIMSVYDAAAP